MVSGGAAGTSLGCSGEATDARGVCLAAAVPSIEANNRSRRFDGFVEMPSVTSQLSMLALHKVGARLDMRTCNDCGLPHILSERTQHHQDSAAAEAMHTCRSTSSVAAVGTSGHSVHLPRSVAAVSASLAASIRAVCSTSVTVCIADRRLVCSYTRVGRGRDHDHPRLVS